MSIDTAFLRRCIQKLEAALEENEKSREGMDDVHYALCHAAYGRQFERILEQSGKLLRKRLAAFFASNRQADLLDFRDLFRHAAKHGLIDSEAVERWLGYRDSRNGAGHDDLDEDLDDAALKLLPVFVADAKALADMIEAGNNG